jgi:hypothetical protein
MQGLLIFPFRLARSLAASLEEDLKSQSEGSSRDAGHRRAAKGRKQATPKSYSKSIPKILNLPPLNTGVGVMKS